MATFRQIHVSYWQDPFVLELTPEEKYFYIYLMTNSKTTQCGIYELPKKIIELETGYNRETVEKLLNRFIDYQKILYCEQSKEVMLLNWLKHNAINSVTVKACITKELQTVKNTEFVNLFYTLCTRYQYGMDRVCIVQGEEEEEEKEKEEEKELIPYKEIIDYLNSKIGSSYKHTTEKTKELIQARYNEGFTLEDFKKVVDNKVTDWNREPKQGQKDMRPYLRPITLFSNKFESYLNEKHETDNERNLIYGDSEVI